MFSFSSNIYLAINNIIITTHLIIIFLPSIFHILNYYFEFINPSWLLNSKQQPHRNLLKRYRKQFYQRNIKIREFLPTNNQLLENTDEATLPMTTRHTEINQDLLSNLFWYLAPKKHWRKIKFGTESFNICADSGASSCTTSDEIDFIPDTYIHLISVTINGIAEGFKVAGCGSASCIFQDDKKDHI